jgi:hypothetical protein
MRALLSLIAGSMLLNLSAHAVAAAKEIHTTDGLKALDEDFEVPKNPRAWEKQEMEDSLYDENHLNQESRGFEKYPRDYQEKEKLKH